MKRSRLLWFSFALCLAVVLAAMGWISLTALRLDEAERQAALEEKVRLALWRADSTLRPLINDENVRPWFAYRAFFPADQAYSRMFNNRVNGERLVPSPLLTAALPPNVLVYFQFEPDGRLTSPQVPDKRNFALAVPRHVTQETVEKAQSQLDGVRSLADRGGLLALLPDRPAVPVQLVVSPPVVQPNATAQSRQPMGVPQQSATVPQQPEAPDQQQRIMPQQQQPALHQSEQSTLNSSSPLAQSPQQRAAVKNRRVEMQQQKGGQDAVDYDVRQQVLFQSGNNYLPNVNVDNGMFNGGMLPSTDISGVPMTPLWVKNRLVLARRVAVNGQEYVQGCLLDWPAIQATLRDTIADLLPDADFEPVPKPNRDEARMLAALPVRLLPGARSVETLAGELAAIDDLVSPDAIFGRGVLSPIRVSLGVAWVCMSLAAMAVAGLLAGVMRLSERRASFVTAVTHELRTPLTTFQMYAEMLAEGMVPEGAQQRQYLSTLRAESVRLTHLVENVLSYARLERGRTDGRREAIALGALVERMLGRLAGRAEQAGMELVVEGDNAARGDTVMVNGSAVEQIVFNLVDNACKYAADTAERRIQVSLSTARGTAEVRVRDHGPGLSASVQRRLFRPFSKSAREAAHSAPGVGLGLTLSRRLARDMGGDLRLEDTPGGGACFVLALPLASGKS